MARTRSWGGDEAAPASGAAAVPPPAGPGRFSVKHEFEGACVLLTGCTGYIGSLVLESLLRTTRVRRVHVLLRGKRGCGAQERCDGLLQGPIFHLVRDKPELLSKVVALPGDLGRPRLGLSTSEVDALASEVDIIIHAAADIRLEAPIQETLRANYMGTRRVLELATQLPRLRSMVHVSTAYVNINHPHGATVRERIYPLMHGEVEADGERIAEELLALPPVLAERRSDFYRHHFGFPNTYCLGKHLAEQMVARAKAAAGLPVAVVRPSLVTGVAGLPWAGHIGNYAGLSGMGAAAALGFFPAASAYAVNPHSVWDAVPGDLTASAILATAAAVAAGRAPAIAAAAAGGARAEAAAPRRLTEDGAAGSAKALPGAPRGARRVSDSGFSDDSAIIAMPPRGIAGAGNKTSDGGESTAPPLRLPSAAGDDDAPPSHDEPLPLILASLTPVEPAAAAYLAAQRQLQQQQLLERQRRRGEPLLVVHATTGATYPSCASEAINSCIDFLKAHPSPNCLLVRGTRGLAHLPAGWQPDQRWVAFWRLYNWAKVALVCLILRLFGLHRAAQKLSVGFQQWCINNHPKAGSNCHDARRTLRHLLNDTGLLFDSAALQLLHAHVEPRERLDYLLTFGPPRAEGVGPEAWAAAAGPGASGVGEDEIYEHPAARMGWRRYAMNCMAGIMHMMTGATPPRVAQVPNRPEEVIEHDYKHIR